MALPMLKHPRIGWRDASGAYVVTAANDTIYWGERFMGGLLSATIAAGTYSDLELASLIKTEMEAASATAGNDAIYSVWRDEDDGKFYFQQLLNFGGGPIFDLAVVGTATPLWPGLGFTTDRTGSVHYGSDLPTPDLMYFDFYRGEEVHGPEYSPSLEREDLRSLSGKRRSAAPKPLLKKYSCDLYLRTQDYGYSHLDNFLSFINWALQGGPFRWWPEKSDASRWVEVQLANTDTGLKEMLPAYMNFSYRIELEQVENNQGTIDLEDLQERNRT